MDDLCRSYGWSLSDDLCRYAPRAARCCGGCEVVGKVPSVGCLGTLHHICAARARKTSGTSHCAHVAPTLCLGGHMVVDVWREGWGVQARHCWRLPRTPRRTPRIWVLTRKLSLWQSSTTKNVTRRGPYVCVCNKVARRGAYAAGRARHVTEWFICCLPPYMWQSDWSVTYHPSMPISTSSLVEASWSVSVLVYVSAWLHVSTCECVCICESVWHV